MEHGYRHTRGGSGGRDEPAVDLSVLRIAACAGLFRVWPLWGQSAVSAAMSALASLAGLAVIVLLLSPLILCLCVGLLWILEWADFL